jgi:hypothetical protein
MAHKVTVGGRTYGLGREYAPDERDRNFLMSAVMRRSTRTHRYWFQGGWWGDQGSLPHCVAFGWTHWLEDGPIVHDDVPPPLLVPKDLYDAAQLVDEWPGTDYDGTSVRAGAKVLKSWGHIQQYRWAFSLSDVVNALLEMGPVVVGTKWYQGMFSPDANYFIHPTGSVAGGHAWVLNGVNTKEQRLRLKNSWGRNWGRTGNAFISFDDFEMLLEDDGEACIAVEAP